MYLRACTTVCSVQGSVVIRHSGMYILEGVNVKGSLYESIILPICTIGTSCAL